MKIKWFALAVTATFLSGGTSAAVQDSPYGICAQTRFFGIRLVQDSSGRGGARIFSDFRVRCKTYEIFYSFGYTRLGILLPYDA